MELFKIDGLDLSALPRTPLKLEREIQRLLEANLETVFGIRFLATEHSTGEKHAGRIDSLGIDENGTPVVIEYKLSSSENIINQALYYMDWLVDHKGDFELLVQHRLGTAVEVDWTAPRVICVADSFSKYDTYAVQQMGRNIQLVQYRIFDHHYLAVDVVGGGQTTNGREKKTAVTPAPSIEYSVSEHLERAKGTLKDIAEEIREYLLELGEDVTEGPVKHYVAYRTTRNFCCLEVHQKHLFLYLTLDPSVAEGCADCRDVSSIGHFGTGNLEVRISSAGQVKDALHLIDQAYKSAALADG
jgi:predicted transport protein